MSELTRIGQLAEGKAIKPLTPEERVFKKLASNESAGGAVIYEIVVTADPGVSKTISAERFTYNDIVAAIEQGKAVWFHMTSTISNIPSDEQYIPLPGVYKNNYVRAINFNGIGGSIDLSAPDSNTPFTPSFGAAT